jgi:hypothetical protein
MGHLDQLAKLTFAEETGLITSNAVEWQAGPEMGLTEVHGDGLFRVLEPERLIPLAWPWPAAQKPEQILVEVKMVGDHLDEPAMERALLRRQAFQVQRMESDEPRWRGQQALWLTAPILPEYLGEVRRVRRVAAGCYWIEPASFEFLWIAANELPLCEELIPFLLARSGRPLVEFVRWVTTRRPPSYVLRMIEILPMPMSVQEEFERYLAPVPRDDPEIRERSRNITKMLLKHHPEVSEELIEQGIEQGIERGIEQGIERGIEQGIERGIEQGIEQGIERGIEQGIERGLTPLVHQYERRLGRSLTAEEHHALLDRFTRLGSDRIGDVVLDLSAEALGAWLADPAAV